MMILHLVVNEENIGYDDVHTGLGALHDGGDGLAGTSEGHPESRVETAEPRLSGVGRTAGKLRRT